MSDSQIAVFREALAHLPPALRRFRQFVPGHLSQVRAELRAVREALSRAQYNAEVRVSELRNEIVSADEEEDTSWQEQELAELRAELDQFRRAETRIQRSIASFEHHAARLAQMVDSNLPRAEQFLARKTAALQELCAIKFEDLSGGVSSVGHRYTDNGAVTEIGAVPAISNPDDDTVDLTAQPLPAGFRWVKLEDLNLDAAFQDVRGPADFRSYASYETIQHGLQTLRDRVLPAIAQRGYSADSFHFQREDRRSSQNYENGNQRIFDAFFGSDSIAIQRNPATGKYDVINGRHRIRVAADARWLAVPVKIAEGRFEG